MNYEVRFYTNEDYIAEEYKTEAEAIEAGEKFLDKHPFTCEPYFEIWKKIKIAKPTNEYDIKTVV